MCFRKSLVLCHVFIGTCSANELVRSGGLAAPLPNYLENYALMTSLRSQEITQSVRVEDAVFDW